MGRVFHPYSRKRPRFCSRKSKSFDKVWLSLKCYSFVRSSTCKFQQSHSDSEKHPLIAIGSKHLQARLPRCSVHHPKDAKVLKWKKTNTLLVARAWPPYITGSDWWPPVSPLSFCKLLLIVLSTRHTSQGSSTKMNPFPILVANQGLQ